MNTVTTFGASGIAGNMLKSIHVVPPLSVIEFQVLSPSYRTGTLNLKSSSKVQM